MKKEELGELILASQDAMYHVAKTLLYNDADCADAIQEAIVKAFSKLDTLKKDAYGKTWLMRILINECYGIMRRESGWYLWRITDRRRRRRSGRIIPSSMRLSTDCRKKCA